MPTVRAIVRDAARNDYRFSSIVLGIVKSTPFEMRKAPEASPTVAASIDATRVNQSGSKP